MRVRLFQAGLVAALAACGTASSQGTEPKGASGTTPFTTARVAEFDSPWALAFLPGSGVPLTGAALVTEKGGALWLVDTQTGRKQRVTGVPRVRVAGQGGLGDVVPHPDFAGNQRVYLSYVEPGPRGTSGAAVGYGQLLFTAAAAPGAPVGVSLQDFKVIWRQTPKVSGDGHFGHRLLFAPDGSLFISSGDRQKMQPAQDLASDLGKIIHLTAEGAPVPGPWASRGARAASYYSIGHRNPLGLAWSPDGRLWSTEMGPEGGDELNLILPGRNYGWPVASFGSHYGGRDIPDTHKSRGFEPPKQSWNPSISPGGLLIYRGRLFPNWRGDALIPALSGQALIRVNIVDGVNTREVERWDMGARIRAVDEGPRGELYLLEDGPRASLLRLEPRR